MPQTDLRICSNVSTKGLEDIKKKKKKKGKKLS